MIRCQREEGKDRGKKDLIPTGRERKTRANWDKERKSRLERPGVAKLKHRRKRYVRKDDF